MEKRTKYDLLLSQLECMVTPDIPVVGNICNLLAQLRQELNLFWCGLYLKQANGNLGIGPFSGLPACTKITWGKGVCGTAAAKGETVIVDDVSQFPGYIACHSETRSEIVIPGFINGEVAFVLDIDSTELAYFDEVDKEYLEKFGKILEKLLEGRDFSKM
jgi:L-methionine (R)-S-oxide reductase